MQPTRGFRPGAHANTKCHIPKTQVAHAKTKWHMPKTGLHMPKTLNICQKLGGTCQYQVSHATCKCHAYLASVMRNLPVKHGEQEPQKSTTYILQRDRADSLKI